ncbi:MULTISPECIES: hypothetical protein [unclassified Mesorhizobium]|uniref:hypothetical protein n=1 Tax=unclassified Mesorhizobium TaxID=325217 RepID=UPI000FCB19C3|nr:MULTISPECIES: hypothetical protein [unclassified Mesorhizobium]RUX91300.1 hypothetical protein EN993_27575 [Mesorhizobium sp. M7D.F.Ca.US.004.01.2.1]RVA36915.1 hypothetical protein EN935_00940 [Mesorhizobium sp. M7D.F.Ca.US.004.03.1.1]
MRFARTREILNGIAAAIVTPRNRSSRQDMSASLPLVAEWPLPPAATLGSSVRTKGIEREIRARLPWAVRKYAKAETGHMTLRMGEDDAEEFEAASNKIAKTLETIEVLPVLPREAEDILTISSRERHKWLKDGRLQSIGTRTVKMRGRSKAVTFHVFDPKHIEDVLDRDLPSLWREEDVQQVTQNRRRGAGKAALTRAGKGSGKGRGAGNDPRDDPPRPKLKGWDAFDDEGLLR